MANYTISNIEGIGPVFAGKLAQVGVRTVNALLDRGADRQGRKQLAELTGIEDALILKWVNMADLYRVNGIGSEYADLLERAGVDTVKELRNRNADNLYEAMATVNAEKKLVRKLPGRRLVVRWVESAKQLDPRVTY